MGRALARRLVEAQGGSVGVRSSLGAGSVLRLALPCRRAPEAQRVPW
jgi:signal transduction histidine kinase